MAFWDALGLRSERQSTCVAIAHRPAANIAAGTLPPICRAIHRDGHVPWFGYQLACGNSLVGARRQAYPKERLTGRRQADFWFNEAPARVAPGPEGAETARPPGTVYHFLLPDPGMASYGNKLAKELEPDNFARLAEWRRSFFGAFTPDDVSELERLSDSADRLWTFHIRQLAHDHREIEDR